MTIGEKIKRVRTEMGWTQEMLSKRARVRQTLISELERGMRNETRTDIARRLARTLRVDVGWLITPEEEEGIEDAA